MANERIVGVLGIGSTNFLYGVGEPAQGEIRNVRVAPTRAEALEDQIIAAVAELRESVPESLDGVSIAAPGLVADGVIKKFDTPAGAVIDRIEVNRAVETAYGLPSTLENDCNASALAEWYYGVAPDHGCVAHVTFGTGIGVGVVDNGRLLRGHSAQAGEFGLVSVAPESELGSASVPGAWEAFCSGRGIPRYARHELSRTNTESELRAKDALEAQDVFAAASNGDRFAGELLDRVDRYNAVGVAAVANAVNPGLITLGGGVALNNPHRILEGIERHLDRYCFVDPPAIRVTELGEQIGLYGALACAANPEIGTVQDGERATISSDD